MFDLLSHTIRLSVASHVESLIMAKHHSLSKHPQFECMGVCVLSACMHVWCLSIVTICLNNYLAFFLSVFLCLFHFIFFFPPKVISVNFELFD